MLVPECPQAHAHGETEEFIPDQPGLRVGVSAAYAKLQAEKELPTQRLSGFLLQGDAGIDRRANPLEHAVASFAWRMSQQAATHIAVGWHGTDPAHIEAAWLQMRPLDNWTVGIGRNRPSLGPVILGAGHLDKYALVPLAKQAALGDAWIDNGVEAGWRSQAQQDTQLRVDAGLWRGRTWPGGSSGPVAASAHAGLTVNDWALDGFVAHFEPRGRGARVANTGLAHTHGAPTCDAALTQVVCFSGRTQLAGVSARWLSQQWPVAVSGALLWHRDAGTLESRNGIGNYRGDTSGGWLEGLWNLSPNLETGLRLERLSSQQSLEGTGVSIVATEAGVNSYQPARRTVWMLGWKPAEFVSLRLEAGEDVATGKRARFTALRAVFRWDNITHSAR